MLQLQVKYDPRVYKTTKQDSMSLCHWHKLCWKTVFSWLSPFRKECTEKGIKLWERVRLEWKAASVQRAALQVIWKWSRSICTQASSLNVEGSQSSNNRTRPCDWKLNKSTNRKILKRGEIAMKKQISEIIIRGFLMKCVGVSINLFFSQSQELMQKSHIVWAIQQVSQIEYYAFLTLYPNASVDLRLRYNQYSKETSRVVSHGQRVNG